MTSSRYRRRHRPWYRKITWGHVGFGATMLAVLVLLFFGWQAMRASSSLRLAASQAEVLQNQIVAGDSSSAKVTLAAFRSSTERARSATDGPLWDIASKLPLVGKNIEAIQTVSEVSDEIATDALPPVVALADKINLNTFSPKDGKVDLAEVAQVAPSIATADAALTAADRRLSRIDTDSLLAALRGPVEGLQLKVASAQQAASSSNTAARLLPTMLGGKDTRRYLLLIQNNAELRSTGGISGSFAILKAQGGKLSMGEQGSISDLKQFSQPVLPMTKDEKAIFAPTLVTNLLDANVTPDFPRTGEITRAMVKKGLDVDVDGVMSVDPIALSHVLEGLGRVEVANGVFLDKTNAVETLLNTVYRLIPDPAAQNVFFAATARKIFDAVASGRGESRLVIGGLVRSASENRLMLWSAHDEEQKQIDGTGLSGALSGDDGATPHVGIYLGDAASTKMEYYLDYTTSVKAERCLDDNVQELTTSTDFTSTAPVNAASLPRSVTGDGKYAPRGTMRLIARFYSPYKGGFTDVRVDGKKQTVYADRHHGRNVTKVLLSVKPGETVTVTTSMISGAHQGDDVVFSTTPGARSSDNDVVVNSSCR